VLPKANKERKNVKINVGMSNLFFKLAENGVYVWLPNVVEKVPGGSN